MWQDWEEITPSIAISRWNSCVSDSLARVRMLTLKMEAHGSKCKHSKNTLLWRDKKAVPVRSFLD